MQFSILSCSPMLWTLANLLRQLEDSAALISLKENLDKYQT